MIIKKWPAKMQAISLKVISNVPYFFLCVAQYFDLPTAGFLHCLPSLVFAAHWTFLVFGAHFDFPAICPPFYIVYFAI